MTATKAVIAHLTTLHPRWDPRIRLKEVASLARALDADVRLYVQDGQGDEVDPGGYRIIDIGPRSPSRLSGMIKGGLRMIAAVRRARPDVVHFHDPELLPWALLLRLSGTKVVYDVHEDLPRLIRHSPAFPAWLRPLLPIPASVFEWVGARLLSAQVAATPDIAARFPSRKTVLVQNHALIGELHAPMQVPMRERPQEFAYIGGISLGRGILQMLDAITQVPEPAKLAIAGWFAKTREQELAEACPGWRRVRALGIKSRDEIAELLSRARAGLVLFQPLPNNIAGRPIKLFEYMSAGLPVIASDYPRWREIVDGAGCGLLVDPEDPAAIAHAMQWMLDHPDEAQAMGERGRRTVLERYSWESEATKLVDLYTSRLVPAAARVA